jgi:hypothetical protein
VFVIALLYGPSKPISVDEYLHDFLEKLYKVYLKIIDGKQLVALYWTHCSKWHGLEGSI